MNKYKISVCLEKDLDERPIDNFSKYDFKYFEESEYRCASILGIKVFEGNTEIKSAVIGSSGGGTGIYNNSVIIESDRVLICCSNSIFCLSIPELQLLWQTEADWATCFGIHKHKDSYIVHGELQISRLDQNGKIVWQQSGGDIFTTLDGKDNFEITDKFILATDWDNRKYKFDFDGRIIS